MVQTIVGVLRGGDSSEYELSLRTGAAMLAALPESRYRALDIFIDKAQKWHHRGIPMLPARILAQVDVILNGLHGGAGEDGTIQRILENAGTPYVGARPLAAASSLNKIRARELFRANGLRTPQGVSLRTNDDRGLEEIARTVFSKFGPPYVVKPPHEGAGEGIQLAAHITELPYVLSRVLRKYGAALVEELVRGREVTVGVIEGFRGEELYALPPAEVRMPDGYDFQHPSAHLNGLIEHIVPSSFSQDSKRSLMDAACVAHRALGLSHYSRSDFILTPRGPYILETNANPGLYQGAAFPHMLESVGSSVPEFLSHSIALAHR